jgi:hypothetical protein
MNSMCHEDIPWKSHVIKWFAVGATIGYPRSRNRIIDG